MRVVPRVEVGRGRRAVFRNCEVLQSGREDGWAFVDTKMLCRFDLRVLEARAVTDNAQPNIWFWG